MGTIIQFPVRPPHVMSDIRNGSIDARASLLSLIVSDQALTGLSLQMETRDAVRRALPGADAATVSRCTQLLERMRSIVAEAERIER